MIFFVWFLAALRTLNPIKFDLPTVSSVLQALVQFSDSETASAAKDALDGRSIPR